MKLYKFRPTRIIAKTIAREIAKKDGFRVEIHEILPNVCVVNQTDEFSNGKKDAPIFVETKPARNP